MCSCSTPNQSHSEDWMATIMFQCARSLGIIGFNNLKQTGYVSAVVHSLVHVPPVRDFFLIESNYVKCKSPLVRRFGELVRKIWNPRNFKGHVSPHELMQAVTLLSDRKFQIGKASDALEFLSWFLNALHTELGGNKKKQTIITQTFQGMLLQTTEKLHKRSEDHHSTAQIAVADSVKTRIPFLYLLMDPPSMPVFKDVQERNIIPQIPLYTALAKFDGQQVTPAGEDAQKKFQISTAPRYIITVLKRFKKNNFFSEKNKTIVTFPIKNLDLSDYMCPEVVANLNTTKYDLLANVCHLGNKVDDDEHEVNIQNKATGIWYRIQDMEVEEAAAQLMTVSEAYIQIWERQRVKAEVKDEQMQAGES
eukprot:c11015_g1_i2.p1 GENE.c11015_g1_i2~~c11015_g1_i2.p1  ORF type:complete len:364 (-),score=106.27 c11015_g1_i2:84-1175(-)